MTLTIREGSPEATVSGGVEQSRLTWMQTGPSRYWVRHAHQTCKDIFDAARYARAVSRLPFVACCLHVQSFSPQGRQSKLPEPWLSKSINLCCLGCACVAASSNKPLAHKCQRCCRIRLRSQPCPACHYCTAEGLNPQRRRSCPSPPILKYLQTALGEPLRKRKTAHQQGEINMLPMA